MNSTTTNSIVTFILSCLIFYSCNQTPEQTVTPQQSTDYPGLRKLSDDEIVERVRTGTFPDPSKGTYILESGDTISIDSLQSLDRQSPIAIDDYVDDNGTIILSVVRAYTENDEKLKSRMQKAYNEYRMKKTSVGSKD